MNNNISIDHDLCRHLPLLMVMLPNGKKKQYRTLEIANGNILLNFRGEETVINIKQLQEESELGKILNIVGYMKTLKDVYYNQEVDDYQKFGYVNNF